MCCFLFSCATFGGRFADTFPEEEFTVSSITFLGPVASHISEFYPLFNLTEFLDEISEESGKKIDYSGLPKSLSSPNYTVPTKANQTIDITVFHLTPNEDSSDQAFKANFVFKNNKTKLDYKTFFYLSVKLVKPDPNTAGKFTSHKFYNLVSVDGIPAGKYKTSCQAEKEDTFFVTPGTHFIVFKAFLSDLYYFSTYNFKPGESLIFTLPKTKSGKGLDIFGTPDFFPVGE